MEISGFVLLRRASFLYCTIETSYNCTSLLNRHDFLLFMREQLVDFLDIAVR